MKNLGTSAGFFSFGVQQFPMSLADRINSSPAQAAGRTSSACEALLRRSGYAEAKGAEQERYPHPRRDPTIIHRKERSPCVVVSPYAPSLRARGIVGSMGFAEF